MKSERRGFIFARYGVRMAGHHRMLRIPAGAERGHALGVWVAALGFSREEQLDGFCPLEAIHGVTADGVVDRLVEVGLFSREQQDGIHGVRILKYEDFNDTKEEIEKARRYERRRKHKLRQSTDPSENVPVGVPRESRGSPSGVPQVVRRSSAGSPSSSSSSSFSDLSIGQDLPAQKYNPPDQSFQDTTRPTSGDTERAGDFDSSKAETESQTRLRKSPRLAPPSPGPIGQPEIDRRRAKALSDLAALSDDPSFGSANGGRK